MRSYNFTIILLLLCVTIPSKGNQPGEYAGRLVPVLEGWAGNSVNATVFRKNSIVTEGGNQFIAFYDNDGYLCLGKRLLDTKDWTISRTQYTGNIRDAHNGISIMTDVKGYLHVSWDHHGHPLRYAVSTEPYGLELGEKRPMTQEAENHVTYPEFMRLPDGGLLFVYRDGGSGSGNLAIKRYDSNSGNWYDISTNLIDGEKQRNAYWQCCMDNNGTLHLSWVWRESPDVASNHDLCYARSRDGGTTWENSRGVKYELPITVATAEVAVNIPQNSELINQTSMTADRKGRPYIATYWRDPDSSVPQYRIVYNNGAEWIGANLGFRKTPFTLSGGGTKSIPISRPQVVARDSAEGTELVLIFRDEERGSRVSAARSNDLDGNIWTISDLTDFSVGAWEPSLDTELWRNESKLHIFVQQVEQVDAEGVAETVPKMVYVLEAQ